VRGGREEQAQAASLLIAGSKMISELSQMSQITWDDEVACRKAREIRLALYGRNDYRTAEAISELSKTNLNRGLGDEELNDEEEYRLLVEAFEIRKATLPEFHPDVADSLKFMGRFFQENHEDSKKALPFLRKALAIFEHNDPTGMDINTVLA